MSIIRILTQFDIKKTNVRSQLEQQNRDREAKDGERRFDKFNSMTICFYKTTELKVSSYVKIPLIPSAVLNFETDYNYCFYGRH